MTATINEDCSEILIDSDYLDPLNQSVTLTVTLNCTTTYDDIDIDVAETDYTLDATSLDLEELATGIYTLTLVVVQESGDIVTEVKCVLLNCDLNCDMIDVYTALDSNEENVIKALSYHALVAIADCNSCSCSDWCTLYNTVIEEPCTEDAQPCGCS